LLTVIPFDKLSLLYKIINIVVKIVKRFLFFCVIFFQLCVKVRVYEKYSTNQVVLDTSFMLLFVYFPASGEDRRSNPIDLYLLVDASSALKGHYDEALSWFRSTALGEVAAEG